MSCFHAFARRYAPSAFLLLAFWTVNVFAQAPAGAVEFANGPVKVVGTSGERLAQKGEKILVGDQISTGSGRAQIRFNDGGFFSLQPNTEFRVDDYNFSGKADGAEKSVFSFFKGAFRAITGVIGKANKSAYLVNTPVATIGIRGTGYSGETDGQTLKAAVFDGAIFLRNKGGELEVTKGNAAVVLGINSAPQLTYNRPTTGTPTSSTANTGTTGQSSTDPGRRQYLTSEVTKSNGMPVSLATSIAAKLGVSIDAVLNSNLSGLLAAQGSDNVIDSNGQNVSASTDPQPETLLFSRQISPAFPGQGNVTEIVTSGGPYCEGAVCYNYYHSDIQSVVDVSTRYSASNYRRALQFNEPNGQVRNVGTAANTDADRDAFISWGRWTKKSSTDSDFFFTCGSCHIQTKLSANNGFNYVSGSPTTIAQTGKAVYTLLGASTPSSTSANARWAGGTVTAAKLIANFDQARIDASIDIRFPNAANNLYRIHALNLVQNNASQFGGTGVQTPAYTPNAFAEWVSGGLSDCSPNCSAWVEGAFFGNAASGAATPTREGAQRAGLVYTFKSQLDTDTAMCGNAEYAGTTGAGACIGGSVAVTKVAAGVGQANLVGALASPDSLALVTGVTAYFDASNSGKITVIDTPSGSVSLGTAVASDMGTNTDLTWSRWSGGFVGGSVTSTATTTTDVRAANAAVHAIVGVPATAIPTAGTANYSLFAATTPSADSTSSLFSGGSVTSGSLLVNFGTAKVTTQINVSMPNYRAGGIVFNVNSGPQTLSANGTWAGSSHLGDISSSVKGFLAGAGASSAGVAYQFVEWGGTTIRGVAAFSKSASSGL